MAVNLASRRVMEKAGLTLVRIFHQPWPYRIAGEEHGDVEYALRKADWEHQEAAGGARVAAGGGPEPSPPRRFEVRCPSEGRGEAQRET